MVDFDGFARLVHEAYARLYDRPFLREHPLARLLGGDGPGAAERLHRQLLQAIEELRPIRSPGTGSVEWRRYRHLQARYAEGVSPELIARELGVSPRQARRDHADALDQIARLLWRRVGPVSPPRGEGRDGEPRDGDLDAELIKLAASGRGPTDLAETLRGVAATVARLADEHRVSLAVEPAAALPPVQVARTVLRQLLLGLLSDAIVRCPGQPLPVTARRVEDAVLVEVAAGPAAAGQLEPLRRLARTQGAQVVEAADGRSTGLRLPVSVRTLLVVDDNPDVALLFRRYLGESAYRIVQARSSERAVRLARELRPDVVFLDVLMPLADGWEILQALRADPDTAGLRVVICSVLPDPALARSLGADAMLAKPVTRAALLALLEPARGDAGRPAHP